MPIDIYYTILSPPARAVLVLSKYLKLDVNLNSLNLMAGDTKTPEFLKVYL